MATARMQGGRRAGNFGSRGQRVPWPREGVRKGESSTQPALGMKAQGRGSWSTRALVQSPAFILKGEEMVPSDQSCSSEQIDAGNREMLH